MPKPNEGTTFTVLVTANGSPVPEDVAALLASGYVDTTVNVPGMFELHFSDDAGIVLGKHIFAVGTAVEVKVQPADSSPADELISGEVTALEAEVDASGMHVIVRGFDKSHRLFRGRHVRTFQNVTVSDMFKKVASEAGLQAKAARVGSVFEHVGQNAISDWEFLTRIASWVGAEVVMVKGTLELRLPVEASTAPASSQGSQQNALVLERGRNIITLRATLTGADQVPNVEVRGWDVKQKQALIGTATADTRSADVGGARPADLARAVHSTKWIESDSRFVSQAQCDARAKAVADRLGGSFAELDCLVEGNPDLRAGTAIALANVGPQFDGKYVITAARHVFNQHTGYRTHVTVSNASDRSLFGSGARRSGPSVPGHMDGVTVGIVSSVKDPGNLGRVQVKLPLLSDDYVSDWCRVLQAGAGNGHGLVWLPEVGDEVLVAFGQGHSDDAYVLGGVYNGVNKPSEAWSNHVDSSSGEVTRRAMVSRSGMVVEMVETASDERLTISTNSGAHKISLSQKDKKMELISQGPLSVTAEQAISVTGKQNISVSTETGTVEIKGKTVKIEATTDLTLNGLNVTAEAKADAQLKGLAAKVQAQGALQLTASGIAELQGSLVKIN